MSRSTRLLALLQSLRGRRRPVSAAELARELGVSVRTVYRDVAALVEQGAPIEGASGLGYVLRAGYFLPPLMIDADEADAVVLGLRFVMRRGDPTLAAAARAAMAKVSAVLPDETVRRARSNGLVVAPSTRTERSALGPLREALDAERKLHIGYRSGEGRATERVVWPVAPGFFDGAEVLAAWCELRAGFRHFRLDRMNRVRPLEEPLPTPRRLLLAAWQATEPGVEA